MIKMFVKMLAIVLLVGCTTAVAATRCPSSNPYAYYNGDYCCKTNKEKVYSAHGSKCDGSTISLSSLCCMNDAHVRCPSGKCVNANAGSSGERCADISCSSWGFKYATCKIPTNNYISHITLKKQASRTNCKHPSKKFGLINNNIWVNKGCRGTFTYCYLLTGNTEIEIEYEIDVKTGNRGYAGTDSNVFIKLYGQRGNTGKIYLAKSSSYNDKFERGHIDSFKVHTNDVGMISKIRIGHDNKYAAPGWFLDGVVITIKTYHCKWTFKYAKWIMTGNLEAELRPISAVGKCSQVATTGGNANGEACVFPFKYKEKKYVSCTTIDHDQLWCATTSDYSAHKKWGNCIQVATTGGNANGAACVFPFKYKGKKYVSCTTIDYHRLWCATTSDYDADKKWGNCIQGKKLKYDIDVRTGDVRNAGTDSNVFLVIYGKDGDTGRIMLKKAKSNRNKFERFSLDQFEEDAIDVGKITKIRIGHDNKGSYPGWFLDSVIISVNGSNCFSTFTAGRWIQTGALEADIAPTQKTCEHRDMTTYDIDVKTGNVKNAGTDARVYVIIYGVKGDTGKKYLRVSKTHSDAFEQNNLDKFTISAVDVGKIMKIRIGHNNYGSYAGWYLDSVVITTKKCKSTFNSWQWLEKNKRDFDLFPTLEQGDCAAGSGGIMCNRDFIKIGCFNRDWKKVTDLLITDLDPTHENYTTEMNWENYSAGLHSLACRCREKAKGTYKYFGIGFHAECVAGKDNSALEKMFKAGGKTMNGCINGKNEKCNKGDKSECAGVEDFDFIYQVVE